MIPTECLMTVDGYNLVKHFTQGVPNNLYKSFKYNTNYI